MASKISPSTLNSSLHKTAKRINGRVIEDESEVNNKWQKATGLLPKYMSAVRNFEKKVEAKNVPNPFVHKFLPFGRLRNTSRP